MKLLSRDDDRRPQDIIDLRALIASATDRDLEVARSAAKTIEARGYARGRDLLPALDEASLRFRE